MKFTSNSDIYLANEHEIAELKKMRNRAPFRPFQIHLTTGEALPVERPENMSLPENETEMFVVWTRKDWNLVEAGQVARISAPRWASK